MAEGGRRGGGGGGGGGGKPRGRHFGPSGRQSHGRGNKRKDMGRQEYFRNKDDWNNRNKELKEDASAKRLRLDENGSWTTSDAPFSKEDIESEDRRPKRKVAVMIGYSGTGYKGMQIMPDLPTIEGDLFKAMIKAGAISKANAGDPKKSSLVRCARTDKGVHAAGNVISLKLIVEDEDIVQKINEHLPPQIRVWGIERTVGSFSSYQACDSRWYEYLIPTHCFLPPHPSSYLGKRLVELAEEAGHLEGYRSRQEEVQTWWTDAEEKYIKPILDTVDEDVRSDISHSMYKVNGITSSFDKEVNDGDTFVESEDEISDVEDAADIDDVPAKQKQTGRDEGPATDGAERTSDEDANANAKGLPDGADSPEGNGKPIAEARETDAAEDKVKDKARRERVTEATKRLRQAYIAAKTSYRLDQQRLSRIKDALSQFVGTCNHHNYTIRKSPNDPSAKRHIKSFVPIPAPSSKTDTGTYLIGDTEWLSIKVHGQSFMMHQIRKMIGMAALVVRCGTDPTIIGQSLSSEVVIAVPKAPSLGLLLERPVFESYNTHRAAQFEREPITFDKYEREMDEFKEKEIYRRIYDEEEQEHVFHSFFSQIDEYRNKAFLYLSSKGFEAAKGTRDASKRKIQKGARHAGKRKRRDDDQGGGQNGAVIPEDEVAKEGRPAELHEGGNESDREASAAKAHRLESTAEVERP